MDGGVRAGFPLLEGKVPDKQWGRGQNKSYNAGLEVETLVKTPV